MGVPEDTAEADACKIEHDISEQTFPRLEGMVREGEEEDIT